METNMAVPLSLIGEGQTVNVVNINAGKGLKARLTALGLLPKARIMVLRNGGCGPFVVRIKNTRMALGRGVVEKIMVINQ